MVYKRYLIILIILMALILKGCKENSEVNPSPVPEFTSVPAIETVSYILQNTPLAKKESSVPDKKEVSPTVSGPAEERESLNFISSSSETERTASLHSSQMYSAFPEFYICVSRWGAKGGGEGQFKSPAGIVVDNKNYVYVSDSENHRIQKFDSRGKFIRKWSSCGKSGSLNWPEGIASDLEGFIYVADFGNDLVRKFDGNGTLIMNFGNSYGEPGELISPGRVGVDSDGNVYVVDSAYKRVQKFDSSGKFITKWRMTEEEGATINGIIIDMADDVCLVSSLDSTVQKFDSSGKFITKWSLKEEGKNNYIGGLSIDSKGYFYAADSGGSSVQVISPSGGFFAEFGKKGKEKGEFNKPIDVSVDKEGNVYALDYVNCCVQKFIPNF